MDPEPPPSGEREGPRFAYEAPAGCGDEVLFRDLVAARLGEDPFGSGPMFFHLAITTSPSGYRGLLQAFGEGGERSERAFAGPGDCNELLEEVAASLAVLIAEMPQEEPSPVPDDVAVTHDEPEPIDSAESVDSQEADAQPEPEVQWQLGGGVSAGLRFDTAGDGYIGGRAFFFARRGDWSLRARAMVAVSPSARIDAPVVADLRLIRMGAGADGCFHRHPWNLCAGLSAGALRAELGQESKTGPFVTVDLEAAVDVVRGDAGAFRLGVSVSGALAGAEATLDGTTFWSSGVLGLSLWLGYESPSG